MLSSGAHLILIQFLSDFILAFIWLSLTCAWLAFGAHMAHTWLALDSHMAHIWRTSGAHLAHIWRTSGAHLTCIGSHSARTQLALSSCLKTDFIIWPIVTVLYYVLCSACVFMSTSVSILLVSRNSTRRKRRTCLAREKKPPYQSFCTPTLVRFHSHNVFRDIIQSLVPKWTKIQICGHLGFT